MSLPIRDPASTKIFNVKGFLAYEEQRATDLYKLACDCWRAGYKRTKCMELATAAFSDVTEKEWTEMFRYMMGEELKEYTDATD